MAEKKKEAPKKEASASAVYVITKGSGNTIERTGLSAEYIKVYEDKGYTVKKKGNKKSYKKG